METPTTKESPLFIFKKFLLTLFIICYTSIAIASDYDLGTTEISASSVPDITRELFWRSMHPYLKKGAHNYCHDKMAEYPKNFYKNFVQRELEEDAIGKFFIRFYIYRCSWNNESCKEPGSFDKNNRIKFDVHYDFDC